MSMQPVPADGIDTAVNQVLQRLSECGHIDDVTACREFGINDLPGVIETLREDGFDIKEIDRDALRRVNHPAVPGRFYCRADYAEHNALPASMLTEPEQFPG